MTRLFPEQNTFPDVESIVIGEPTLEPDQPASTTPRLQVKWRIEKTTSFAPQTKEQFMTTEAIQNYMDCIQSGIQYYADLGRAEDANALQDEWDRWNGVMNSIIEQMDNDGFVDDPQNQGK